MGAVTMVVKEGNRIQCFAVKLNEWVKSVFMGTKELSNSDMMIDEGSYAVITGVNGISRALGVMDGERFYLLTNGGRMVPYNGTVAMT